MRGRLSRLSNRVAEPTGLLFARIGLSAGSPAGPAPFHVRGKDGNHDKRLHYHAERTKEPSSA